MPSKLGRTTEHEMSAAVMKIAATKPSGHVTLDELRAKIPNLVDLTSGDGEYSSTRPGERMWEQLLRNIQSHHTNPGNFIALGYLIHAKGGGYAITDEGRAFLETLRR